MLLPKRAALGAPEGERKFLESISYHDHALLAYFIPLENNWPYGGSRPVMYVVT